VIDLTRGKLVSRLKSLNDTPQWSDFSMGRIREATSVDLPTSGHLISHNVSEIREILANSNLSNVLVLDDTSFSGSTSLIVEKMLRQAFPEKVMKFTHGFLILNEGNLGNQAGARSRLESSGSKALGGLKMRTPRDDGWHFFDLVKQNNIEDHFLVVQEILKLLNNQDFSQLTAALLSNENNLRLMFPQVISGQELRELEEEGYFLTKGKINGGFHVRNPQLMPNIIGQGHLDHPRDWRSDQSTVFGLLVGINKLLKKGVR